ncbi:hypothetical protein CEXT_20821 [Caerostris extrusa]|uniref:Uncharacterized protein n=1 Tax=Caerostris extrusa TaxID=172846 RepID=A0AAV4ST53_CAEEX|nr:hypothetical protein CEXT_20821 [Caerostris extrusa]
MDYTLQCRFCFLLLSCHIRVDVKRVAARNAADSAIGDIELKAGCRVHIYKIDVNVGQYPTHTVLPTSGFGIIQPFLRYADWSDTGRPDLSLFHDFAG